MIERELQVRGRSDGALSAVAWADAGGATVRLDDDNSPPFWAEVRLAEADLEALLARVRAERRRAAQEGYGRLTGGPLGGDQ